MSGIKLAMPACARNARQPPNAEMSRAPVTASASTRKPFTVRPSASAKVPIDSGGGTAATKRPKPSGGSAQISTSIAAPLPAATRSSPGFGGRVGRAQTAGSRARVLVVSRNARRARSVRH